MIDNREELVDTENTSTQGHEQEAIVEEKQQEDTIEETRSPIEEIEEKLSKLNDDYLRLMAEYDNYRKRTMKEKSELIRNAGEKVLKELLPVVDDFDLAIVNMAESDDLASLKEGILLIYQKLGDFLKQQGVAPIETEGQDFNEELHEAIAVVPSSDESQKGKVIDSVKKGYTLNDKVLRHAYVVVSQ